MIVVRVRNWVVATTSCRLEVTVVTVGYGRSCAVWYGDPMPHAVVRTAVARWKGLLGTGRSTELGDSFHEIFLTDHSL